MNVSLSLWNLISLINMNAYHLRKSEVEYELKVRGVAHQGNANDLRKRLTEACSSNAPVLAEEVDKLDPDVELETCEEKFEDLSILVSDYEGNGRDNEYNRITARLWHLYLRVERIPAPDTDDDVDDKKSALFKKTKDLLDGFAAQGTSKSRAPLTPVTTTGSLDTAISAPPATTSTANIPAPALLTVIPPSIITPRACPPTDDISAPAAAVSTASRQADTVRHYVPVYKWGLKFDNTGPSIAAFLERVEELRRARGVTHQELYASAVDLFAGSALVWYRAVANRIGSWQQLTKEIREVFQPADYDLRLHHELFNRVQGDQEPVDLYIAAMEGLFSRLSVSTPEATRLSQIYANLHPQLKDRLALSDITTLDQLRSLGRRAEAGRLSMTRPMKSSYRNDKVLEPDLAYHDRSGRKQMASDIVAELRSSPPRTNVTCWNCKKPGHRFRFCREPKQKFCWGCGKENTSKPECSACNPKNGAGREDRKF